VTRIRILFLISGLAGCAGLIGVPDLTYDERAQQGLPDGSTLPGTDGGPSIGPDGAVIECNANVQTDANHCGRCGHSCGGGTCDQGKCQPVVLADGIDLVQQIAVDATHLYYAAYTDGAVLRVKLDGSLTPQTMASGLTNVTGVARESDNLYFSDWDGVSKCKVPTDGGLCTGTVAASNTDYSRYLFLVGTTLFFTSQSDVRRAGPTAAGPETTYGTSTVQPWSVAANAEYVYFSTSSIGLQRAPVGGLDGGGSDSVGPLNSKIVASYVAIDGDSVFWSFRDDATDQGFVYSAKHADPAQRISYTATTTWPIGVAADANYVYWTDRGGAPAGPGPATGDGRLLACSRAGCTGEPIVLATGCKGGGHITLDANFIYFAENNNFGPGGRVRKLAKP
jgi:hypothetical protein